MPPWPSSSWDFGSPISARVSKRSKQAAGYKTRRGPTELQGQPCRGAHYCSVSQLPARTARRAPPGRMDPWVALWMSPQDYIYHGLSQSDGRSGGSGRYPLSKRIARGNGREFHRALGIKHRPLRNRQHLRIERLRRPDLSHRLRLERHWPNMVRLCYLDTRGGAHYDYDEISGTWAYQDRFFF